MEGSGLVARFIRKAENPDLGKYFLPCRKLFKTEGFEGESKASDAFVVTEKVRK